MSCVLIFRHVPFEGAGLVEDALRARGIGLEYADLYREGASMPEAQSFAGLIFLGGPMSVNDDLTYLRAEEEVIRQALARGTPLLGVCLGAQLIARATGAAVRRNPVKEIGWYEVEFTPEASQDPLFHGLERETVFHWHGETFDLPPGAARLAGSSLCANQAYRIGPAAWGIQFHLEVTPAMIADWSLQDENCGDVRELTTPIDPQLHAERMITLSDRVFGAWCDLLVSPR